MAQGNFRLACASSISIAVALMAAPAMAQESNADEGGLEEIVVTAQRREQSLQDVPMAISAVSGDTLRDAGTIGIDGLANLVPSLATVSNRWRKATASAALAPIRTSRPSNQASRCSSMAFICRALVWA
jgi:outer membrane receptor protein involved in Fe transport